MNDTTHRLPSTQRRRLRRMRLAIALCGAVSVTAAGRACAQASSPPSPKPPTMRGFAATPTVNMRIFVPSGRVRVTVWDRDSIAVAGSIGANSSMFGGGRSDYVKFGVEPLRSGDTNPAEADWSVTVPRRAHVWVKMTVGTIETVGTSGELELYAVGGSITVRQASGVVSVESIDAAVQLDAVRGDIRVRGGKAPMTLHDVTGTASITSVSGAVTMTGATPECRVETIGGDIVFDATRLGASLAELQTHAGAIRIGIDARRAPMLELSSRAGKVTSPPLTGNAANGRVIARTFKGAVTVTPNPASKTH